MPRECELDVTVAVKCHCVVFRSGSAFQPGGSDSHPGDSEGAAAEVRPQYCSGSVQAAV